MVGLRTGPERRFSCDPRPKIPRDALARAAAFREVSRPAVRDGLPAATWGGLPVGACGGLVLGARGATARHLCAGPVSAR
ncbi:hypothetical protein GCM10020366_20040 [Saccharopolyspora gregorii]|uniref:Uncharacterized protein n=1 Tax=Saccharopolyspora gregorii TaxID=33914 RepID=A0ABP6RNA3_9PSEU